ncbi:transporter substrate-binding domain-containing protein [uncultured Desulfuromusa sp.]|uniref:transporter substrate-binding domain-containing protein n=1 Tax=uncultured Desulfuromusa sp. TaxID=219183 RepID=UPI002AA918EC|nr:transporter substrate-binding domain-containing protein [uncultured Desulfuromusa sp.]
MKKLFVLISAILLLVSHGVSSFATDQDIELIATESERLNTPNLTEEERAWIAEHPVIQFGIGQSWAPFVYKKKDGSLEGYDVDLLEMINKLTGTNIQLVAGQWKDIVEQAQRREIAGLAESSPAESRREHFQFSVPYNIVEYAAGVQRSLQYRGICNPAGESCRYSVGFRPSGETDRLSEWEYLGHQDH